MPSGISIHIGLNNVDQNAYCNAAPVLFGCVNDATAMHDLAGKAGFTAAAPLLDGGATTQAVTYHIQDAANTLGAGDILLVTYSGHGGSVVDTNHDEGDGYDETWCLYDRQLLDDELYQLWATFKPGVRILVLSDSCYSGTVTRGLAQGKFEAGVPQPDAIRGQSVEERQALIATGSAAPADTGSRSLGTRLALCVNEQNAKLYADIQAQLAEGRQAKVTASVLLLGACQDNQRSQDGDPNGLFTAAVLDTWSTGNFNGTYLDFHKAIYDVTRLSQEPSYYKVGVPSPTFEMQRPFTI